MQKVVKGTVVAAAAFVTVAAAVGTIVIVSAIQEKCPFCKKN